MTRPGRSAPPPLGSTYRLQVRSLGFDGAAAVVPYLHDLGVEVLYLSPVLTAAAGSTHGYDVVDPTRLDPALGGGEAFTRLLEAVGSHGMRLLIDVVPNHLAASAENPWWWDVLRTGRAASRADVFDIDWDAHDGRVLLAVLDRPLDEVLAEGGLVRRDADAGSVLAYGDAWFPLDPATFDRDDDVASVLGRQHYRLAYWRLGPKAGNYRRFFDVDGLVGIRQEDAAVHAATHAAVLELVRDPRVAGLRLDHVDGLADPTGYLERLRTEVDEARDVPTTLLVEKILARGESLPDDWPVDGTTGYEFADHAVSVMLADGGAAGAGDAGGPGERAVAATAGAAGARGPIAPLGPAALAAKHEMLGKLFPGQFATLVDLAIRVLGPRGPHDLAPADVARALADLAVHLPVYRTYLDDAPLRDADAALLDAPVPQAASGGDSELARATAAVVRGLRSAAGPDGDPGWRAVARRFQQLTAALAAKGVEDTALYRAPGIGAGVDVGTPPRCSPLGVDAFHRWCTRRAVAMPGGLSALSTHDAKRSEDVRTRWCVLTEAGDRWTGLQRRWDGWVAADDPAARRIRPHDVHLAYQAVVGTWPDGGLDDGPGRDRYRQRIADYVVKAAREAKVMTSWLDPDEDYEGRLSELVGRLVAPGSRFAEDVARLVASIGPATATTGLALTVLRLCAPGVPDTYQGTEVWARHLVDPDNRGPVAFDDLVAALRDIDHQGRSPSAMAALLRAHGDGRVKLAVTSALLRLRRERAALFAGGDHLPLEVVGPAAGHLLAFARTAHGESPVVALVPRLPYRLVGPRRFPVGPRVWRDTRVIVPEGLTSSWTDVLDGHPVELSDGRLDVASALATLPVSVLQAVPAG